FPYAVVKKYGDDEGGREAALITYYGFLSIFPLLLLGVAVLSRVLADHPDLRQRLITAIVPQALRSTVEHSVTTLPTSTIPFVARSLLARPAPVRGRGPGALWGAAAGTVALNVGAPLLARLVTKAGPVYGSFATVAGMFALLYLVNQALVYAAEVAAVRYARL